MKTKPSKPKRMRPVMAWAGVTGASNLDWRYEYASDAAITVFAVYRTRREAMKQYREVRRVEIRELPPRRRGK